MPLKRRKTGRKLGKHSESKTGQAKLKSEVIGVLDEVAPILNLPVAERWAHYFRWKGYTAVQATRQRPFSWQFKATLPVDGQRKSHDAVRDDVVRILELVTCKPVPLGILIGIEDGSVMIAANFEAEPKEIANVYGRKLKTKPPAGI